MLTYAIEAHTEGAPGGDARAATARCKDAALPLDIDVSGRRDAFNPAELLLAALAACMLKGMERVRPMLHFADRGARVEVRGARQDSPPRLLTIEYELVVDTDESDARLDLLHRNIRKFGTVYNTLASTVTITGTIRRAAS